jgi:hypothetical protein
VPPFVTQIPVTSNGPAPNVPLNTSQPTGSTPLVITYTAEGSGGEVATITRTLVILNPCVPETLCFRCDAGTCRSGSPKGSPEKIQVKN